MTTEIRTPRRAVRAHAGEHDDLRAAVRDDYGARALEPVDATHLDQGHSRARRFGYPESWLRYVPDSALAAFAGTGSPMAAGPPGPGEHVVDIACGAGIDSFIAAALVGPEGSVVGVDMTPAMLERSRRGAQALDLAQLEFRQGLMESLPVEDAVADLVISNGSFNLTPDKPAAMTEMARILRPGGRLQIADVVVDCPVDAPVNRIDLWSG